MHAKCLRACAPEGVTCHIKSGAKHLLTIPCPLRELRIRIIFLGCLELIETQPEDVPAKLIDDSGSVDGTVGSAGGLLM